MKEIKLVVCDIDGTLIGKSRVITEKNKEEKEENV